MRIEAVLGLWQDRPANEALRTAAIAEETGYDRIWIGEMATYDAVALATAVATRTRCIEPVVGPLAVGVRSPASIAMGVASVTSLTGRRAHVALGTSSSVVVERWHGRTRGGAATLASAAVVVRSLLAGDRDPRSGFRLRLEPPGSELTVAAFGPLAVAAAARSADRMLVNMVTPVEVRAFRRRLDAAGGANVPLAAWLVAAVDPSPEDIRQIRGAVAGYLAAPGYAEMFERAGFGEVVSLARSGARPRDVVAGIPPGLEQSIGLVGTRNEIDELARSYERAGLDTLCVVPVTATDDGGRAALTVLR